MMNFPIRFKLDKLIHEFTEMEGKAAKGLAQLKTLTDADVDIGSTEKDVIYERGTFQIYHYKPLVEKEKIHPVPVLVSTSLVNGYEVLDIQPDRSLIRNLLNEGIDVYLINWGYPTLSDRYKNLDDYITDYIDDCVDQVLEHSNNDQLNLLGICLGGTFATCYTALFPEKVRNLVLTVTPIDYHAGEVEGEPHVGMLFRMGRSLNIDNMVDAFGNIPIDVLNVSFMMASPLSVMLGKYIDAVDVLDDKDAFLNFLRMEKWLYSGPDVPGEAYRQFAKDFIQGNKLFKGEMVLSGRKVDLKNVTMPVLNVYATRDHLVPPPGTTALGELVGNKKDYEEMSVKTGHIGIYTGGASQKIVAPGIAQWLKKH